MSMDGKNPNSNRDHPHSTGISLVPPDQIEQGDLTPDITEPDDAPLPTWRRYLFPAIATLLLLGGIGWGVFNRFLAPLLMSGGMGGQPPTPVELSQPRSSTVQDSSDYAANLDSRQSVRVQPRVGGQIAAIYVRPGDRVETGQVLVQIDAAEQQAQVASREAATATASADIVAARARVANANETLRSLEARRAEAVANVQLNRKEYQRFQQLVKEGATSQQNADQRLNALQTAEAALNAADAEISAQRSSVAEEQSTVARSQRAMEEAEANVAERAAQLDNYRIVAPVAGIVGNIPVKVGDVVNNTTQLLTVTQNDRLEIQIQVPLDRSGDLRTGLPVRLLDDRDREIQSGRISFIAPDVDPETQSIQAKASFDNVRNLRTAQFIRARVIWQQGTGVLVPTSAIARLAGRNFIFIATPYSSSNCATAAPPPPGAPKPAADQLVAVQKPIELGKIIGNDQEVAQGLNRSDRIVTSGILQLQNCTPIADAAQMQQPPKP
jgi:RND family efflux transporter MFP subunit